MIPAIALRAFRHDGKDYAKDDRFSLSEGQFHDWRDVGLVARAPAERPKGKPKAKSAPAELAIDDAIVADATESDQHHAAS